MGHLSRSIALARKVAQHGGNVRVISNSPFAPILANRSCRLWLELEPNIEIVLLPSVADKAEIARLVHVFFHEQQPQPDVLVVDTFPRGLAGELAGLLDGLPAFKVLVHRDLNPDYVRWADLNSFAARYDLILMPGEDGPLAQMPQAVRTAAWLVCDSQELLSPTLARAALQIPTENDRPICVVVGSGKPDEAIAAAEAARRMAELVAGDSIIRFVSCDEKALAVAGAMGSSLWPLLAALNGVDLLVGAGGYNTVFEARATATPFIAVAQSRLYDRQAHRLLPSECAVNWDHAIELARQFLESPNAKRRNPSPPFANGADEAIRQILAPRAATKP